MRRQERRHDRKTFLTGFFILMIATVFPLQGQHKIESLTLPEALNIALEQNPAINAATGQRQAAEARVWEARSAFFPQLSIAAGYTYYQEPNIIVPIHQMGVFPPLDDQIYETSFQLQWPLFNGWRTRAKTRAAEASVNESLAQEDLVTSGLMEGIGQIFVQARQLEDTRHLVTAQINSQRRRYRETSLLLQEGRVSPADVALINSSVESARADSIDMESKKVELAYRLGHLLGVERAVQPAITSGDRSGNEDEESSIFVPGSGELAGPLVLKARAQLAQAEAMSEIAYSSFWPEISASGVYSYRSGSDLDMIGEWAARITIRFPLFEGGRRIASRNAAQASLRAAEEGLKSAHQEQAARLQIAGEQWQSARIRQQYIERAVESKARSVSAQQEMYKAGRTALSDLLVQEMELLQLQIQERALAYGEMLAMLNYHAIAGTLTSSKVQEIVRSIP